MVITRREFDQKIEEMQKKIDFEKGTPQKNKALLKYIKEYCEETLQDIKGDREFEKHIQDVMSEANLNMQKTYSISGDTKGTSDQSAKSMTESGSNLFTPLKPLKEPLNSVRAGAFDWTSSPILRRLANKVPIYQKKFTPSGSPPPPGSSKSIDLPPSQDQPIVKDVSQERVPKDLEKPASVDISPSDISSMLSTPQESLPEISLETEVTPSPKTSPTFPLDISSPPFPPPTSQNLDQDFTASLQLQPAYLEIPQLGAVLELTFQDPLIRIGRQDFEDIALNVQIPSNFFISIQPKSATGAPTEHFIIEQPKKGEFILKDRANLQRTYFQNTFITETGTKLQDGASFILPVTINNQLSSLTLIFRSGIPPK